MYVYTLVFLEATFISMVIALCVAMNIASHVNRHEYVMLLLFICFIYIFFYEVNKYHYYSM